MVNAKKDELTRMHFTVFGSDGITPLTGQAGSCTYYLSRNGAAAPEAVTIGEIGTSGHYYASFTPLTIGSYDLLVTCPDDRVVGDSFEVEAVDLDDLSTDIDTIVGKMPATAYVMGSNDDADHSDEITAIYNKLPTNNIMGSSVKTDKDDEIDAIKAKTDLLPADPASESAITTAITTSESNIRGADSDDLKDISDQLDTAQADLDNPNQYKADVSALALEASVTAVKADTAAILIDTADMQPKIDIIDGVVDAIKLKTDNLPADPATQTVVDAVLDLLENKLEINEGTSELWLYNDAGDAVIKKWPITDKDAGSVILQGTGPANRGKRTL